MIIEAPIKDTIHKIKLKPRHGMDESIHLLDRPSALAINAALIARRPLLLRGEPGVGKSQLARAAADELERSFIHYTVNSRTETNELLYQVDLVARLAEAQIMRGQVDRKRLALRNFIKPGPMWWAFEWTSAQKRMVAYQEQILASEGAIEPPDNYSKKGVVVLIDELDKADGCVPNGLLDALGHRGFSVPGIGRISLPKDAPPPLIIFTTNNERGLPDAFVRRCFVHTLELPKEEDELRAYLIKLGQAHNAVHNFGLDDPTIEAAASHIAKDRKDQRANTYRSGVAEFLDLLAAMQEAPQVHIDELVAFVIGKQGDRR